MNVLIQVDLAQTSLIGSSMDPLILTVAHPPWTLNWLGDQMFFKGVLRAGV